MLAHGLEDLLINGAVFNLGGGGLWLNTVKAPCRIYTPGTHLHSYEKLKGNLNDISLDTV